MKTKQSGMWAFGLFLATSGYANSDLRKSFDHLTIDCKGSQGSLFADYSHGDLSYKIDMNGHQLTGEFSNKLDIEDESYSTSASQETFHDGTQSWISVYGSKTKRLKNQWIPEHKVTHCTRVECYTSIVPGRYGETQVIEDFNIMLDLNSDGTYKFNRIESRLPGFQKTVSSLGDNTSCAVTEHFEN